MKKFRVDDYMSAVLGSRYGVSAKIRTTSAPVLYASGGIFSRIVDLPAHKAMSAGVKITNDSDGLISDELDRLDVAANISKTLSYCRLFGGACIVAVTNDNADLTTELSFEQLDTIEELRVYDMTQVSVEGGLYNDATKSNFGTPERYRIRTSKSDFVVHESRLIPIAGDLLPESMRHTQIYWQGRSVTERAYQAVLDWEEARNKTKQILDRKQQPVYKMKGLAEAIEADMEAAVQKRINAVDMTRGVLNTVAVDSEDDYEIRDMGLGSLTDIISKFEQVVSAECGLPISVLFGDSASGLNATGEGDLRTFHEVAAAERLRAQPALERLISMICAQKHMSSKVPAGWRIEWPLLYVPTAKEDAEMKKLKADTDSVIIATVEKAVSTGAMSETQAADFLASQGMFGLTLEAAGRNVDYAEEKSKA